LDGSMPFLTFYALDVYINREFKAHYQIAL